ncbi:organic cation transporter protein-like [Branchiostoma floridae]|uniref:Organic cation transporter protein-like n=1 Tax=Branchiostoma floridae TaxID=7739 RepID=A0A9J7MLA6_BRAFL|nr:organic cation transporter protein-like [Branchiostoma floridae]
MAETELEHGEEATILGNTPPTGDVQINVSYDLALKYLGGFGPWQRRVFFLMCLPIGINALELFAIVFLAVEPDYHCRVPEATFSGLNATPAELLNVSIPWELKDGEWTRSQCKRYTYDLLDTTINTTYRDFVEAHPVANRTQIACDQGYEYDTTEYKSTVVTDWDLVCDNSWKVNLAKSLWFAGKMAGAVIGGHAADRWGRKPVLLVSLAVDYISGIACAFSPNYAVFMAIRFIIAASTTVTTLALFVMSQELVSADKRSMVGMVIWVPFALAYVLLPGIAYFIRPWMWLQITVTMPFLFFISFWWLIPESPRWLISRNRHKEAAAVLRKAAEVTKVAMPDEVLHNTIPLTMTGEKAKKKKVYTFVDLFRPPNLRKWTLNIFFNWIVNTLVYYGISLNTAALSGNFYLNFAISGFIEIPAYLISIVILNKFGRRWPLCLMLLFGGVACIVAFFIPKHLGWMTTTLAMIGKFCITASFAVIYVFSAEIFPTVVRQIGMGMSSMSARVGGMVAPFVNLLGSYWAPMPYVIFGGASIAAGLLALLLPETKGKTLPATIEDGENFGKEDAIYIVDEE